MGEAKDGGPWIEHDGSGCPSVVQTGVRIEVVYRDGRTHGGTVNASDCFAPNWTWPKPDGHTFPTDVIRYRVWTPEAIIQLRQIARGDRTVEGPEGPVREKETIHD